MLFPPSEPDVGEIAHLIFRHMTTATSKGLSENPIVVQTCHLIAASGTIAPEIRAVRLIYNYRRLVGNHSSQLLKTARLTFPRWRQTQYHSPVQGQADRDRVRTLAEYKLRPERWAMAQGAVTHHSLSFPFLYDSLQYGEPQGRINRWMPRDFMNL